VYLREDSDLREWLADHGILTPHSSTRDDLLGAVKSNWDTARSYAGSAADSAQIKFGQASDDIYSSWTDSQLRAYLLENGVISPSSKREELIVQAKQFQKSASASGKSAYGEATKTANAAYVTASHNAASGASAASSAVSSAASVASDTLSSAYYAATNAPHHAYDYASKRLNGESALELDVYWKH
jgi:hypothetical protein